MKTCIIFNPVARGEKARGFREQVAAFGAGCTLKPTTGPGAGRSLAAEAVREGFDTIVAAGGDGTLNEVVNGIADVPGSLTLVRLGLLPLGTVNVFAKEIGLPTDVLGAWQVIQAGRERRVDLAVAEFAEAGVPTRRCFVQMAGAGLDARAIERVNWELKKKIGPAAYVVAALQAMRGTLPQVVATNGVDTIAGQQVLLGNGRFYGGRYVIFPQAELNDGLLEVTVFPKLSLATLARAGWNLLRRQWPGAGITLQLRGKSIRVSCPEPVPFHVEGENVGWLPATFSLLSEPLRVLVP